MSKLIASFNCYHCGCGQFLIIQIENDLNMVCVKCAYICELQNIIEQLKNATKELGEK
jgi:Zn ribbon nucleic-acid-binding protein